MKKFFKWNIFLVSFLLISACGSDDKKNIKPLSFNKEIYGAWEFNTVDYKNPEIKLKHLFLVSEDLFTYAKECSYGNDKIRAEINLKKFRITSNEIIFDEEKDDTKLMTFIGKDNKLMTYACQASTIKGFFNYQVTPSTLTVSKDGKSQVMFRAPK